MEIMKVIVFAGGDSPERDISLKSGKQIFLKNLLNSNLNVFLLLFMEVKVKMELYRDFWKL